LLDVLMNDGPKEAAAFVVRWRARLSDDLSITG
jgi:hypothetical protein